MPVGLQLGGTPFGSSRAIVSRAVGTSLVEAVPAAADYPSHDTQVWKVSNAANLPDPQGRPYTLLVGDGGNFGAVEWIELQSINIAQNTITVRRKMTGEDGGFGTNTAPAYPAGYTVGRGPQGSWNRPFAAFPAGQNGRTVADPGIANGSARKARVWSITQGGTAHENFREAYFGHRSYWDPAAGAALYKNWQPRDAGQAIRNDAWEGDEFYLQFRAKISASRFRATASKMLFIQNSATSGSGQFYWLVGGNKYGEKPPASQQLPGVVYGQFLAAETSYGSEAAAPNGWLLSDPQSNSADLPASLQSATSYPACAYRNRPNNMYCWTFPADIWVTYLVHFKFGKDNAPLNQNDTNGTPTGPFPAATDPSYRTRVEIMAAAQGETSYHVITSRSDYVWMFGDGKYSQGYYYYNPPGLNTVWLSQNLNDYIGQGSLPPPSESHQIEYTQVILSRNLIPVPND
jgi:hypothetical protein